MGAAPPGVTQLSFPGPPFLPPVTTAPKRSYSPEAFSDLMNSQLQRLEGTQEARQRYGALLAVLRQQVDAYRQRKARG